MIDNMQRYNFEISDYAHFLLELSARFIDGAIMEVFGIYFTHVFFNVCGPTLPIFTL